jgi:hypothetical protein
VGKTEKRERTHHCQSWEKCGEFRTGQFSEAALEARLREVRTNRREQTTPAEDQCPYPGKIRAAPTNQDPKS